MPRKQQPIEFDDDDGAESMIGAARLRDAEDDVFDVAHNSMIRSAASERNALVASLHLDDMGPHSYPQIGHGSSSGGETTLALTLSGSGAKEDQPQSVKDAVQAVWEKANALQETAVAAAKRAAFEDARKELAQEHELALQRQAVELNAKAEEANRRIWVMAASEKESAVAAALAHQAKEMERLENELVKQKQMAADELEEAYRSMKIELAGVLEEQHATNVNMAVQAAWERAGRLQETAVAAARKEAREAAEREGEARMALERTQLGDDMRRTLQTTMQSQSEEMANDKAEIRSLRQQLEKALSAARDAESNAAKQVQIAVKDAMKAMEQVQKASQDRAVAKALAEAKASGSIPRDS